MSDETTIGNGTRSRMTTDEEFLHAEEQLIEKVAERLLEHLTGKSGGDGGDGGRRRGRPTIAGEGLATKKNIFVQLVAAFGFSGCLVIGGWWLWVRDGIKEAATKSDAAFMDTAAIKAHETTTHPKTDKRLDVVEEEQRTIRESQIRQEVVDRQQTEVLKDIQADVKAMGRRR